MTWVLRSTRECQSAASKYHLYTSVLRLTRSTQIPITFIRAVCRCFDCSGFAFRTKVAKAGETSARVVHMVTVQPGRRGNTATFLKESNRNLNTILLSVSCMLCHGVIRAPTHSHDGNTKLHGSNIRLALALALSKLMLTRCATHETVYMSDPQTGSPQVQTESPGSRSGYCKRNFRLSII